MILLLARKSTRLTVNAERRSGRLLVALPSRSSLFSSVPPCPWVAHVDFLRSAVPALAVVYVSSRLTAGVIFGCGSVEGHFCLLCSQACWGSTERTATECEWRAMHRIGCRLSLSDGASFGLQLRTSLESTPFRLIDFARISTPRPGFELSTLVFQRAQTSELNEDLCLYPSLECGERRSYIVPNY